MYSLKLCHEFSRTLRGKNGFTQVSNYLDTDLKITLLDSSRSFCRNAHTGC